MHHKSIKKQNENHHKINITEQKRANEERCYQRCCNNNAIHDRLSHETSNGIEMKCIKYHTEMNFRVSILGMHSHCYCYSDLWWGSIRKDVYDYDPSASSRISGESNNIHIHG